MIMKHVNLTVQGDRAVRPGQCEQGEDRESTTAVRCETHHRGTLQPASPEASKHQCRCPVGANRWCGHLEKTNLCELTLGEVGGDRGVQELEFHRVRRRRPRLSQCDDAEAVGATKCSQNSATRRAGVKVFSHSNDRESRVVVRNETRTRAMH